MWKSLHKDIAVNIETGFKTVLSVTPSLTWREGMSKAQGLYLGRFGNEKLIVFLVLVSSDIKYLQCSGGDLFSNVRVTMSWYPCSCGCFCERSKPSWKNIYGTHLGL